MFLGFIIGIVFIVIVSKTLTPSCKHEQTEHVSKCMQCGKVFDDNISEMRKRI